MFRGDWMQALKPKKKPFHVGMRTIKTLISAGLVTFVYSLLGRNPCFACIGAVFGMGAQWKSGLKNGGNRFVGSIIGGLVAIPFYPLYKHETFGIPGFVYLTLGLAVILIVGQWLGADGGIQPGTVVFYVVLFTVNETNFVSYTIARMIDTGVGVALSVGINMLFPSPLEEKPFKYAIRLGKHHEEDEHGEV